MKGAFSTRMAIMDRLLFLLYSKMAAADEAALNDLLDRIEGAVEERVRVCRQEGAPDEAEEKAIALAKEAEMQVRSAFFGSVAAEDELRARLFEEVARDAYRLGWAAGAKQHDF